MLNKYHYVQSEFNMETGRVASSAKSLKHPTSCPNSPSPWQPRWMPPSS